MTRRYCQRVRWLHDGADDPVVLWAEVVDGWEVRKVDEFADGHLVRADGDSGSGSTWISSAPMPPLDEIAADPQFVAELVAADVFESVWQRAAVAGRR